MKRNNKILLVAGGIGLIGLGLFAASRGSKPTAQQPPAPYPPAPGTTPPILPTGVPGTQPVVIPTPPASAPIGIGTTVKAATDTYGYNGAGMNTAYEDGGTDEDGILTQGTYAGTIIDRNDIFKSFKVRNFQYPMKQDAPGWGTGDITVYEYWVPQNAVKKL